MDFVNRAPMGARLLTTVFGEDRLLGAVIARPTFRYDGQQLIPTPAEPWPIEPAPMETPWGTLPADTPFLSGGVDVFVMGSAHAAPGAQATDLQVDIRIGRRFSRSLRVVGDRHWERKRGGPDEEPALVASAPRPFTSMPLSWDRAFGGAALVEGQAFAFPANPAGRGLYLTPEQAEGQPLPNLERIEAPVRSFADQPLPVGTAPYPPAGSLRATNAVDMAIDEANPENSHIARIKPLFFNAAAPEMIIPPADAPKAGDPVEVSNVRPGSAFRFAFPAVALHAHVQLEDRGYVFPLHLDQIGILTDERRVFLSYRTAFKYRFVAEERRRTTLHTGPAPAAIPGSYRIQWED